MKKLYAAILCFIVLAGCNKQEASKSVNPPLTEIMLTTLPEVAGYHTEKTFGIVCAWNDYDGNGAFSIEGMFQLLRDSAKKSGANAVVNIHITGNSYDAQGSKWVIAHTMTCGDSVVVK
ncbi:hypothetical protein [Duganella levis]|uniref:Lipoprotein n=1 Tax=Duganella levis TaxID=2692169 RepID=A0ABW9VZ19_9BURK|nr:hypothetical protein [Duganella levis]MYN26942.1 hypothetical protein [Duganella levis]